MSSDIPASDNFDPVPGVKYEDEKVEQPTEAPKVEEKAPEQTEAPSEPQKPAEPKAEDASPEKVERPQKAKPIADLLSKKHEAEERASKAEAENAELKAQIAKLSEATPSVQTDDKIKALAEKHGIDETVLSDIISAAREGVNPQLPKEVQDLLAERQAEKVQQAELTAFNKRVDSLATTLKEDSLNDPKVREKLLKLAYSTEKAPDGEPYFQKELSELYFGFIKPEIEPGTVSAEPSRGGSKATEVVDFEEIYNRDDPKDIDKMDSPTFEKYITWVRSNKETKTPLKRIG